MGAFQWLAVVAALCAAVHGIGVSSKVDLPGSESVVQSGSGTITSDVLHAVLNVNVKNSKNPSQDPSTSVNAVVCVNGAGPCPSSKTPSSDEDEEEESNSAENSEEQEDEVKKDNTGIVFVDQDDDPVEEERSKRKKKKKVPDVPVLIGYRGVNPQDPQLNDPVINTYDYNQSYDDVPILTGFKLGPEFDKPHTFGYLQPTEKDIAVTYKHIPIGFDESTVISHIFDTSPLIKALTTPYNPVIHHHGVHQHGVSATLEVSALHPTPVVHFQGPTIQHNLDVSALHHDTAGIQSPGFQHHNVHEPNIDVSTLYPRYGVVNLQNHGAQFPNNSPPIVQAPSPYPRDDIANNTPGQIDVRTFGFLRPRPVPGFYGGYVPRPYIRGVVRPGCNPGIHTPYQPPPGVVWTPQPTPAVKDKVDFGDEDEETGGESEGTPMVVKVDGKLGGALEGKT